MRSLARRTDALRQSDIRALTAVIKEHGGINLGQGICDMPAPDVVKEAAVEAIRDDRSVYTSHLGIGALRDAIFRKARSFNRIPCGSPDEVLVSAGSTGAFVATSFALLDPGDEVILFEPYYGYHRNLLRLTGATIRYVTLRAPDWTVDFDALEAAVTPSTKMIVLNTPTNPCGKVWTRDELGRLLEVLDRHDLYAVTDEIYEYMTYDGREHVSLAAIDGAYERTVTVSGFSKTYNMTGWRLGYAVAPPALLEKISLINDLFYICAPTPLQHGVLAAFDLPDAYFSEMLDTYAEKRDLLCDTLAEIGFDAPRPEGAYYVLAGFEQLADRVAGFENDARAARTLVERSGVAVIPGGSFFADPTDGRYLLRFCYAKEKPVLEAACRRLRAAFMRNDVPVHS